MPGLDTIIKRFQTADRNTRLETLLDYSKKLPPLPDEFQEAKEQGLNLVPECQTPVFLWIGVENGKVRLHADVPREAPTVRGFVSLLAKALDGATPEDVALIPNDLLDQLALSETLGMTRTQGLSAILMRIKRTVAGAAKLLAVIFLPTVATIVPPDPRPVPPLEIVEYEIPRAHNFPHDPAVAPDGAVWYTDQSNSYIGRLDPTSGKIADYPTPTPHSGPHGLDVAPDGSVWYTAQAAGRLGRLDPKTGKIIEYPLPATARNPHTPIVYRGKIWFTDANNNSYGQLDPATGKATVYQAPTPNSVPYGITAAPDGAIWVALLGTNKLGQIDPAKGVMREHVLPNADARPRRLAVGRDGTVWYTDYARSYLGALDPKSGAVREWKSPSNGAGPYGIAIGSDGRIWYNESNANLMVAFDPRTEKMETVAIPTAQAVVRHMVSDPARGRLWLALSGTGRLGKIELGRPDLDR